MGTHRVSHKEKNHHSAFQKMECPCMQTLCFLKCCCNPSLGLATKGASLQGCGPRTKLGVTFHAPKSVRECEGMNRHTPK